MKDRLKINTQKGFTLLELLVAISIMAIGLLGTVAMQSVAMNSNSIANRSTVVTAIAQEVMDELMSRPTNDPQLRVIPGAVWTYDLDPLTIATDRNIPSAGTYRAVVTTLARPNGFISIMQIRVRITRIDDVTNKGLQGVRGSALDGSGAFDLIDYKNIPGI
jgi:prepilin-type N-terminal cleavage/methylation domain-containing protein